MKTTSRLASALLGMALLAPASAVAITPAAALPAVSTTTATCQVVWGSLAKSDADSHIGDGTVTNLRTGRHTCYDRVVIDIANIPASKVGYSLAYVNTVRSIGSGQAIPLDGAAQLKVRVTVPAYNSSGAATYSPQNQSKVVDVTGYSTLRQVALAGSFEGQTIFGVGVRARLPYRVFLLDGPGNGSRLVLDVAHRW
ncbi:MAG: hypothetical protein Q4P07_11110 [Ornithinimicrobium sp.]|uniref:AMIN-like domain-containing (lipo)protein n=1 Tax=Ornithinimicrobium sp. TaxID=1977084 RepID=UPI0026E0FF25|nr:hypothetical protein [Ornithinimicrobium sp.]MDO5740683.1 hypothetical protein [Ornithinimicrobium sp.]